SLRRDRGPDPTDPRPGRRRALRAVAIRVVATATRLAEECLDTDPPVGRVIGWGMTAMNARDLHPDGQELHPEDAADLRESHEEGDGTLRQDISTAMVGLYKDH